MIARCAPLVIEARSVRLRIYNLQQLVDYIGSWYSTCVALDAMDAMEQIDKVG